LTDLQAPQESNVPPADAADAAVTSAALGFSQKPLTPTTLAWRRFRRHKLALLSTAILFVIVVLCAFAGLFTQYGIHTQIRVGGPSGPLASFLGPRRGHWFGTDDGGYDEWTNVLYGGRISLAVGGAVALISVAIGSIVGVIAGYYGRWVDNLLMRVTDLFLSIPFLVSLIIGSQLPETQSWARAIMGPAKSMRAVIVILSVFFWMPVARVIRGLVLSLKEKEFIESARAAGASDTRIMFRHLLPNCTGQIIINTTLGVAAAILTESALSFLGFGIDPVTAPTWGNLISAGQGQIDIAPHLVWIPGLAITLTVLCVNFIGDGLRDALDPKQLAV
jgi:peptide/nickel transport system permease protein